MSSLDVSRGKQIEFSCSSNLCTVQNCRLQPTSFVSSYKNDNFVTEAKIVRLDSSCHYVFGFLTAELI